MKETFYQADSGNIYQIIHGWFERNEQNLYFFSWMNGSTKGVSLILPDNTKIKDITNLHIAGMLGWISSETQSSDILKFIIKDFKQIK